MWYDSHRPKTPPPPDMLKRQRDDSHSAKWALRHAAGELPVPDRSRNKAFFARVRKQVAAQQAKHAAAAAAAARMEALITENLTPEPDSLQSLAFHFNQQRP